MKPALVTLLVLFGPCSQSEAWAARDVHLQVVSSRADTVSGNDALVRVTVKPGVRWKARLNGQDITSSFRPTGRSDDVLALVSGLKRGKNRVEIRVGGTMASALALVAHSLAGPIFSGPHQEPFICQTTLNGLGPAQDADCAARTVISYYYKSTDAPLSLFSREKALASLELAPGSLMAGFKPYNPNGPLPADVAQTVLPDGQTIPYIVRREIGTLNRAVYDIQFLHQPGQPLPNPWTMPTVGWNGRLVYFMGGGCGAGYRQGMLGFVGRTQEPFLAQGYAVATSTLNIFENNCNDRVSAETLSMVKEHFIKTYGPPVHTIGWGGSGGAMQLYLTAQNYPGLLDGIIPFVSFPDMTSTLQTVVDCHLLDRVLTTSKLHWTEAQKTAVSGFASSKTCEGWTGGPGESWPLLDPQHNCDSSLPKEKVYDANTNPQGARCDFFGNEVNVFGRDPRTGFARRPFDNVGVQYGLAAFNRGKIDSEQFVDLNERIGGYDEDGQRVSARMEADTQSVLIAYQRGLIMTGGGGLGQTPIIDWRPYSDDAAYNHDLLRSFVARARIAAVYGRADNQIIIVDRRKALLEQVFGDWGDWDTWYVERAWDLVPQMNRWLDNIAVDRAAGSLALKIARDKPSGLADNCRETDGETILEPASYEGQNRCHQLYPPHADPRIAAGAPLTDDVLKCALKPIGAADYAHPLTAEQLRRLKAIFTTGVCDYSRPGVAQQITTATWQRFDENILR